MTESRFKEVRGCLIKQLLDVSFTVNYSTLISVCLSFYLPEVIIGKPAVIQKRIIFNK